VKLSGAKILIESLKREKVEVIFGFPGGVLLDVYDELYATKEIRHILVGHEQGAAHAADGYASYRESWGMSRYIRTWGN